MIVFKNYFKLLRSSYIPLMVYLLITIVMTVITTAPANVNEDFYVTRPSVTIIDNDQSDFSKGLVSYLEKNSRNQKIELELVKDSLFFSDIDAAIIIEEDFASKLYDGEIETVEVIKAPSRAGAIQVELMINKYLNLAKIYIDGEVSQAQIVEFLENDLEESVDLVYNRETIETDEMSMVRYYFNFISYALLAAIIASVSVIMQSYSEKNIKMRSSSSPISFKKYNFQIILGNITVATLIWFIYMIFGYMMYGGTIFNQNSLLMILNSFVFTQVALAVAYAIGVFVVSKEVQSGLANVLSLGFAFLGGAFVPQAILGDSVLTVSRIIPTYWYVKSNDLLGEFAITSQIMNEFWTNTGILIVFVVIIYGISLYFKNKFIKYIA